jgi:hypothetical protein
MVQRLPQVRKRRNPGYGGEWAYTVWEGAKIQWTLDADHVVHESIDAGAQDVPFEGRAGCAYMIRSHAGATVRLQHTCFKDNLHTLYATPDINCVAVYYCTIVMPGDPCKGMNIFNTTHFLNLCL